MTRTCLPGVLLAMIVSVTTACSSPNPLLQSWDTPFGVPPFDQIADDHYLPAFRAGMEQHWAEIQAIINTPEPPTFANTLEALERSGGTLARVSRVFYARDAAHSNESLRETARIIAPELAEHSDDIQLNQELYRRVREVYDQRDRLELTPEQLRLLEETHKGFVRAGVALEGPAQQRLREINAELARRSQDFSQNLLKETNEWELHVTDRTDLGQLPASLVAAAAQQARRRGHAEGWSFNLQRPSFEPFLQYSPNRALRRQVFEAYYNRGDNDNEQDNKNILSRMAALRAERAALMEYPTHAHYVLSDNMAETPERVYELLDRLWEPALRVAKEERDALQQMMHQDGLTGELQGWDWSYYAEKVRMARYALDEEYLRAYFQVEAVRDGIFLVANRLWGLTFEARPGVPRWHPDQEVFEVKEADGRHLGLLYMDYFTRETKRGGAWMNSLRVQNRLDVPVTPVVTNNLNFPPPSDEAPSLISFNDALTMAHEFGHALHGLFSDVTYESLAGTRVPRDFVEFPSQIMENWMSEPEVMRLYARHYQTGEVIPDELIAKLEAADKFGQGFATVEYLAASYLDMAWHMLSQPEEHPSRAFEDGAMNRIGLIEQIEPRYRSTNFQHIFAGGYSAGYYAYIWAEVLDADAFQAFKETELFHRPTARRLRDEVLARGGSRPGMDLYLAFRGRPPAIEPLLQKRGLIDGR